MTEKLQDVDKVFDVAILGTGWGGLIAALQLIQTQRTVLLLKEKRFRPTYLREGYRFLPFSNFSEKRIPVSLLRKILPSSDLLDREKVEQPAKPQIFYQVILPNARIDLYRDPSLFQREMKREFPTEWRQIESFYGEMDRIKKVVDQAKKREKNSISFPIHSGFSIKEWLSSEGRLKREWNRWLSAFSVEFNQLIQLQMVFNGNLCPGPFPISLASYLLRMDEKDREEKGIDLEMLTQGVLERYNRSGGRIEEIEGVEKVEMNRRKGFHLFLKGREGSVQSRFLILNIPLHRCASLLGKRGEVLSKWQEKIQPRYVMIPFFLGVRERGIPVGMKDRLVSVLDLERPWEGGNLLLISMSEKGDERQAPEGKRALTAQALLPFGKWDRDHIPILREGVMNHLKHLFPFLENHLEFFDQTWVEDQKDCWSYPHFLFETHSAFKWRKGVVPLRMSKGLFFSGKENFPYLGLEGEILGGILLGRKMMELVQ